MRQRRKLQAAVLACGMIMPKNLFFLTNSQTSGGRSASSCVICQSSIMRTASSTGPSRKACSSTRQFRLRCLSSSCQSGLPENSSPSKPTVPASSARVRFREVCGVIFWYSLSNGALSFWRRKSGSFSGTAIASANDRCNRRSPAKAAGEQADDSGRRIRSDRPDAQAAAVIGAGAGADERRQQGHQWIPGCHRHYLIAGT